MESVKIGDSVFIHSLNLKGTVSSLPNDKGILSVQTGIISSKVNLSDLELLEEIRIALQRDIVQEVLKV